MSSLLRPAIPLLLLLMLALPGAACAWEIRLTDSVFDQQAPAVSGSTVVWQDNRNGNWDIYLWDGLTGETRRLTDEPADQVNPQIAGHWVVWEDYRNSIVQKENPDIYLLDLQTGAETMVNSALAVFGGYECTPAISDDLGFPVVTWIEKAPGISEQGRVFFRRYIDDTEEFRQAYQDSNTQTAPWVTGQKLVWTDVDEGGVYFRYVPDNSPTATKKLEEMPPEWVVTDLRSSGDRIVWSEWDPERWQWNVKYCELSIDMQNGTKRWLSEGEWFQMDPAIDGDLVAWSDFRSGRADIYLFDLASGTERVLVSAASDQLQTALDGEIVAFRDTRNENNEIYLAGARESTPLPGTTALEGAAGAPRDPDGDGLLEDVNGNGRADFADVVLYFDRMDWIGANEPAWRFDYNGNGRIDFADVVWLFNAL
jgi:beta propeller repeat protein